MFDNYFLGKLLEIDDFWKTQLSNNVFYETIIKEHYQYYLKKLQKKVIGNENDI